MEEVIRQDLEQAVEDIVILAYSEDGFTFEEILGFIFKFYGAVTRATHFCVITPEEARNLHIWLVSQFEL
jgi:hypothetical protein